jgi:hypothetical protein
VELVGLTDGDEGSLDGRPPRRFPLPRGALRRAAPTVTITTKNERQPLKVPPISRYLPHTAAHQKPPAYSLLVS